MLPISSVVFNRQSVQRAIRIIQQKLKTIQIIPPNGLAIFCGEIRPHNCSKSVMTEICHIIEPPLPIKHNQYYCDKRFHTELIEDLFKNHSDLGLVIVTSIQVLLIKIKGTYTQIIWKFEPDIPTDTRRGGSSASRLARTRQEKKHNLFIKIRDAIIKWLGNASSIVVAGNANLHNDLIPLLSSNSKFNVPILGSFSIDSNFVMERVIEQSHEIFHEEDIKKEKSELERIKELIAINSDKCIFGLREVKEGLEAGMVERIICSENLWNVLTDKNDQLNDLICQMKPSIVQIRFTKWVEQYGGIVGILYWPGFTQTD